MLLCYQFECLPTWYRARGQRIEQLFPKDSPEFLYWVTKNLYELADFTANKLIKSIWRFYHVRAGASASEFITISGCTSDFSRSSFFVSPVRTSTAVTPLSLPSAMSV